MDKLSRDEQYEMLLSIQSIEKSLSTLVEDAKERKQALKMHLEMIDVLEGKIHQIKDDPFGLNEGD